MDESLFKTRSVKIDTLGEYLASVRNQLNMDAKTVSSLAQIKPEYLTDLEKGNYADLPPEVYVRGFLKSLSQLYHIKEEILIDQYEKERGIEPQKVNIVARTRKSFGFTPRNLIIGGSIIVALAALFYVGSEIRSVLVPPFLQVSEPATDTTVSGNSVVISGKSEVGADVFINNQPVLTDSEGQFTENLLLGAGLNVVEISAQNKFGKVTKITRQINSLTVSSPVIKSAPVTVTINIGPGSAWVYLEADGIVVQRGTMLSGSTKTVTANNDILLTSANAGSTDVVYNSKDLGKLGREGEVIRNVEFQSQ